MAMDGDRLQQPSLDALLFARIERSHDDMSAKPLNKLPVHDSSIAQGDAHPLALIEVCMWVLHD